MNQPGQRGHEKLYFAYGSNLSLPQMARRCPGSFFVGLATLCGYRWQINERGVANVVQVAHGDGSGSDKGTSQVEGLLYVVTPHDEAALDRYEGTSRRLYQKQTLSVKMLPHPHYTGRPTEEVSRDLAQRLDGRGRLPLDSELSHFSGLSGANQLMMAEKPALVYISEHYTKDGIIRDEYVSRMQIAVKYALALGVCQDFVDAAIMPHLGEKEHHGKGGDDVASRKNCGVADCAHSSERLCHLRVENRQPHKATGILFDTSLLALLAQRMAEAEQDNVADADASHGIDRSTVRNKPIYVVVLQAPLVGTEASYSIEAVTHSLALANELAMKYFRDACSGEDWEHSGNGDHKSSSSGAAKNAGTGPPVIAYCQPSGRPGTFGCVLDNNRYMRLDLTSQNGGQVHAWVTMHEVLE